MYGASVLKRVFDDLFGIWFYSSSKFVKMTKSYVKLTFSKTSKAPFFVKMTLFHKSSLSREIKKIFSISLHGWNPYQNRSAFGTFRILVAVFKKYYFLLQSWRSRRKIMNFRSNFCAKWKISKTKIDIEKTKNSPGDIDLFFRLKKSDRKNLFPTAL